MVSQIFNGECDAMVDMTSRDPAAAAQVVLLLSSHADPKQRALLRHIDYSLAVLR